MIKNVLILAAIFITLPVTAQKIIKGGGSVLFNYEEWIHPAYGGEAGVDIALFPTAALSLAGLLHYGTIVHENYPQWPQMDRLLGLQADVKFFFSERFSSGYVGIGADVKHLRAKYFFQPTPDDPVPTMTNMEINAGVEFGGYHQFDGWLINPFFYLGANPTDRNEYPLSVRAGLRFGFFLPHK